MSIYHRAELTERIVEMVLRPAPALSTPSGVFLSAPRRTGKSTFLVEDLMPALEAQDALVIYVDLWSRAEEDPAIVLADTVSDAVSGRGADHRRGATRDHDAGGHRHATGVEVGP